MDCVTPSHTTPIPYGESIDIYQLLVRPDVKLSSAAGNPMSPKHNWRYEPRRPVLEGSKPNLDFLDAQITRPERKSNPKKSRSVKPVVPRNGPEETEFPPLGALESLSIPSHQLQSPTGTTSSAIRRSRKEIAQ
jgi:hypothetical protein